MDSGSLRDSKEKRLMKLIATAAALSSVLFVALFCCRAPVEAEPHLAFRSLTAAPAESKTGFEQKIIAMERSSWDLAIKRDAEAYRALHSRNFFTVSGQGVSDRIHSESSALDPNVHFDRCDLSKFAVNFEATDAVLVTYYVKAVGRENQKPFVIDSYATSLWVKHGRAWLNSFYQATPARSR
jgi:hypothetical protein